MAVGMALGLLIALAGEGFAQRGDRAVPVQGRQAPDNEQRMALVIGNHAYTRVASKRHPGNDARDMAETLIRVTPNCGMNHRKIFR